MNFLTKSYLSYLLAHCNLNYLHTIKNRSLIMPEIKSKYGRLTFPFVLAEFWKYNYIQKYCKKSKR